MKFAAPSLIKPKSVGGMTVPGVIPLINVLTFAIHVVMVVSGIVLSVLRATLREPPFTITSLPDLGPGNLVVQGHLAVLEIPRSVTRRILRHDDGV